jgi:Fungal Zn(2)-Cys(6) binuclear cluster domain
MSSEFAMAADPSDDIPMPDKKPQTCDTCKIRHQKCDSVRPACHHCRIRGLECKYSSFSAKSSKSPGTGNYHVKRSKRSGSVLDRSFAPGRWESWSDGQGSDTLEHTANIRKILSAELVCPPFACGNTARYRPAG